MVEIVKLSNSNKHLLTNVEEYVFDREIDLAKASKYITQPNHLTFLAVENRCVVGQVRGMVHFNPDKSSELYIDNLGVAVSFRRQKIATKLMAAILEAASKNGCTQMWLVTEPDNTAARGFYESLGYRHSDAKLFEIKIG